MAAASICYDFFLNRTCFQGELFPWTVPLSMMKEYQQMNLKRICDQLERKKKQQQKTKKPIR